VESSSENQQRLLKVAQYKECVQNRRSPELALDAEDLVVLKLVLYGLEGRHVVHTTNSLVKVHAVRGRY
jgi:hypothetical protein